MESREAELQRFKRIDLVEYTLSRGYAIDRKSRSRSSAVVRHPRGDKLIVSRSSEGTYYYFNAKGNDSGTIIDLVQSLDGGTIGDVRKTLRQYSPNGMQSANRFVAESIAARSPVDRRAVWRAWEEGAPLAEFNPYLSDCRKIPPEVYLHPIFADRFRLDRRGNVIAAHHDDGGLCGFEIKNGTSTRTTFTGFSTGGKKGLCSSRGRSSDRVMVVTETFIDMLSVATILGTETARFFSTSGRPSTQQMALLQSAAKRMPAGSKIQLRLDNDRAGQELCESMRSLLRDSGLPIENCLPSKHGADWNDILRFRAQDTGRVSRAARESIQATIRHPS